MSHARPEWVEWQSGDCQSTSLTTRAYGGSSNSLDLAGTISVRLDDDAQRALVELEVTGLTRSEAVRTGLQAAARHLRDRRELLREAELLATDEDDVAEAHAVRQMMEDLRAAW